MTTTVPFDTDSGPVEVCNTCGEEPAMVENPQYVVTRTGGGQYQVRLGRRGPLVRNFGTRRSEAERFAASRNK